MVLGEEVDHFWLVKRMAKATGTDLVGAWEAGLLTHAEWSQIVTRCRGCTCTEACVRFLDKPVDAPRDSLDTCLNRARMARLRAELEAAP